MTKRRALTDMAISSRAVQKPGAAVVEAAPVEAPAAVRGRSRRPKEELASRDFKTVLARVNRDGWKELKRLSTDTDESFQDIFIDALNEYLRSKGYSPVVESRVFPKD